MASKRAGFFARFFKRQEQPTAVQPAASAQGINNPAAGPGRGTEEVLDIPVKGTAPKRLPDQQRTASVKPADVPLGSGTPELPTVDGTVPLPPSVQDLESTADTDATMSFHSAAPTKADTETDTKDSDDHTGITDSASEAEPETTPTPAPANDGSESEITPELASTPVSDPTSENNGATGASESIPETATASESDPTTVTTGPIADTATAANARILASTGVPELRVVTIVSLVEHAGAGTVAAALGNRAEAKRWQIRATGPGLTRAAFSGMLTDTDALVLVSPADPASTSVLGEKLRWLIANNRPALPGRTIFVINLGSAQAAGLQFPADVENPVVLLPMDPALALPAVTPRAPRRAARRAIDQLVEEISSILEEQS